MYTRIPYWIQNYGNAGIPEQKAVEVFMDCETREMINSFRSEIQGIAQGNFQEESLDKIVGTNRKIKFGSYQEWAKLVLLWIANYKS